MTKHFPTPAGFADHPRPPIELKPVNSKQVKAVGYDEATKTLAVQFLRGAGAIYHYPGVEPQQYVDFVGAESIGRHFDAHIKPLPFTKYPPEESTEAVAGEQAA